MYSASLLTKYWQFLRRPRSCFWAALLSACLARLCWFPFGLWPLAFVCWVPVLLVGAERNRGERAALFFLSAVITNALALHFLPQALLETAHIPLWASTLLWLFVACVQSCHWLVVGWLLPRSLKGYLWLFPLLAAAAEVFMLGIFPWSQANLLQASALLSQAAAFGGAWVLTTLLLFVNVACAAALITARLKPLGVAIGILLLMAAGGGLRLSHAERASPAVVQLGLVQTSWSTEEILRKDTVSELREESLRLLRQEEGIELLLWPESAESREVSAQQVRRRARDGWLQDRRGAWPRPRIDVPLILGAPWLDKAGARYNSALLLSATGELQGRYDKRRLVPGGETARGVPGGRSEALSAFQPGEKPALWTVNGVRFLPLICVEDLHADLITRDQKTLKSDILVSLTSGGWFPGKAAGELHFELSKLRAIETGRPLVRVANRGVSAWVDPWGRVRERAPSGEKWAGRWEVSVEKAQVVSLPLATKWGAAVLLVGALLASLVERRRQKKSASRANHRCERCQSAKGVSE